MERIEIGDFLVIAQIHSGVDAHQLARMPRVLQLASAALAAPFAGFGPVELYQSLAEKAGIYCARIVTYHPLPDGNKRTGYDVMREFLYRNGATFSHPASGWDAMYKIALTTSRLLCFAGRPAGPAGGSGSSPSINSHCRSVRSLG